MCGTTADKCNPLEFLNFMGDPTRNGVSPFSINYPHTATKPDIVSMNVDIKLCNESVFEPYTNSTKDPCSCQDCLQSCAPLPPYSPTDHWELDIGDIQFNMISFVTLLIYLAFLVMFIAGSILYYKFNSSSYTSRHAYPPPRSEPEEACSNVSERGWTGPSNSFSTSGATFALIIRKLLSLAL